MRSSLNQQRQGEQRDVKLYVQKLIFAILFSLILTVAILEVLLPALNARFSSYFRRSINPSILRADDAQRFFGSKRFDSELGWDRDPIARDYVATKRYIAQSYGDSFVQGDEVSSEETWQAQFERLTGRAILNLGVGAYGLDQAVLKFEKYGSRYPTRIAILGLYNQMFRRALSYHSFYYFTNSDDFTFAFKPIFVKSGDRFELIRPPCADAACLIEILSNPNHQIWQFLARYDHWYQNNTEKPVSGFPNTLKYIRVLPQILHHYHERQGKENYFFVTSDSFQLVQYLIDRFVKDSREAGMTPVCVMLYSPLDLRLVRAGIRLDDKLLKSLVGRNIPYVDTAQYILEKYRGDDRFDGLRTSNGHLNGTGNLLVAEALRKGFSSLGVLGTAH